MSRSFVLLTILFLFCYGIIAGQETINIKDLSMNHTNQKYGIEGHFAPELDVAQWVDGKGEKRDAVKLSDYDGKFKVIYCFQAWCPGCHSVGLPSMQKMVKELEGSDKVTFMAIQTVFEGKHANTFERMVEIQKEYDLAIPFGHDEGSADTGDVSHTMYHYRTGGTPWFILIDQNNRVIFNDFHLNTDKAIEYLKSL